MICYVSVVSVCFGLCFVGACSQDSVSVVGYPTGGESLSVTQGVVSRIDLVEYLGDAMLRCCDVVQVLCFTMFQDGKR